MPVSAVALCATAVLAALALALPAGARAQTSLEPEAASGAYAQPRAGVIPQADTAAPARASPASTVPGQAGVAADATQATRAAGSGSSVKRAPSASSAPKYDRNLL